MKSQTLILSAIYQDNFVYAEAKITNRKAAKRLPGEHIDSSFIYLLNRLCKY